MNAKRGCFRLQIFFFISTQQSCVGYIQKKKCPTRGELVFILYKFAKLQGNDVTGTADLSRFSHSEKLSADEKSAMQWAVCKGLVNGSGNALDPGGLVNRAQYAAILERYLKSH